MDNGGNLYIESVDIGINHTGTTFFDYLGIYYIDDGGEENIAIVKGVPNCVTSDLKFNYLGGFDTHFSVDRLETNGSDLLLISNDGQARMFMMETDSYKAISSSILMGAIKTGDSLNKKAYLVSEMVNCFMGYNPVTTLNENISAMFNTGNYPNPFSLNTTIQYSIQTAGPVESNIYNVKGQVVRHLVSEEKLSGDYSIVWDATNDYGSLVEDGFYFYTIKINEYMQTEKMILLR